MVCYNPQKLWPPRSGGGSWVQAPGLSYPGAVANEYPCRRCQGCRARQTAEWVTRMQMETRYHEGQAWFVTCTFADEHLPDDFSVSKVETQKLMKRIRFQFNNNLIRYFLVGEYGDEAKTHRPHYHLILWGLHLDDLVQVDRSQDGFDQWESPRLTKCWGKGMVRVGKADPATMSYVAGYCFKKINGKQAAQHYQRTHSVTGELVQVEPEFALMSRMPGLGFRWADEFRHSDLTHDDVRVDGRSRPMPSYLRRKQLEGLSEEGTFSEAFMDKLARSMRAKNARLTAADRTPERLAVREELHRLNVAALARGGKT